MTIPTLILTGTPFERGRQHGMRFRAEIAQTIAAARAEHGPAAYGAARGQAALAWPAIETRAPDVAAEINGIAAGVDACPLDILLRSGFELFGLPAKTGCSAIAARGPAGALVAQNWDAPLSFAPELVLFLHFGPEGFEQAIIASYGGLCWVGCNRHGLAFVNNDLMLSAKAAGLPSQIIRRLILAETSMAGALAQLKALPHMGGRSYLLGDASGAVAGVEVSAKFGARLRAGDGPVLHTNHCIDPEIRTDESEDALMGTYPSSRHRLDVLKRKYGEASVAAIGTLLSDREGTPDAVAKACSAGESTATLFSVIFDCAGRCLYLCSGAPTDHAYQKLAW